MSIERADQSAIPELVALINSAYRGEGSKQGWTTEADLLEGELRTDAGNLRFLFEAAETSFLLYRENERLLGCVMLQRQGRKIYLGMLAVSPAAQGKGIGKKLMNAAEHFAGEQKAASIFMRVIFLRTELIAWYKRQGYFPNGQTEAFPADNRFGVPTQPLHFVILEKPLLAVAGNK